MDRADRSAIVGIVAGNAITIAVALWQEWSPLLMLWPYWFQSVAIGFYNARRMLALKQFSTEGFKSNGQPVPETRAALIGTVVFFAFHYGFFHLVYFVFLAMFTAGALGGAEMGANSAPVSQKDLLLTIALGAMFFWSHRTAFRQQVDADRGHKPNLGAMMFLPYLRIIPMHLMIILGAMFGSAGAGTVFFGLLKTLADVSMHFVEHRVLRKKGAPS